MKKSLILAFLLATAGASSSAFAQTAGPKNVNPPAKSSGTKPSKIDRKKVEKMNEAILAKLDLTADQKKKIDEYKKTAEPKVEAIRKSAKKGSAAERDAAKEKMKALRKENQAFMKKLLTKEQMTKMQKLRREEMKKLRDAQKPKA